MQGYVALLDVLGFSLLVSGDGENQRLQEYLRCLQEALDVDQEGPSVDYVVFSDSIVLTTTDSHEALLELLSRCSRLLGLMLERNIALRGAIAYGSYFRSSELTGVFVAGRAVLDAYRFERAQDWVGIMLAPSVIKQVPDLTDRCNIEDGSSVEKQEALHRRLRWAAFVQPCFQIPFHSTSPFESTDFSGFAIVPSDGVAEPASLRDSLDRSLRALERLKSLAPDPSAQHKYNSPHGWLWEIRSKWREVAYWAERFAQESA